MTNDRDTARAWRCKELKLFLRSRRERITPDEVGLGPGGRRRTPGLRREEVAVLSGVGTSWYIQLEQGRDITVSAQVIDSIATTLRMAPVEREHLRVLAGITVHRDYGGPSPVEKDLLDLVDAWMPHPAHALDACWNILAANKAAQAVFGFERTGGNCLEAFFAPDLYRGRLSNWDELAPEILSAFRRDAAIYAGDRRFMTMVADMSQRFPEFRELWEAHDLHQGAPTIKRFDSAIAGPLEFRHSVMHPTDQGHIRIVLHTPAEGTPTASAIPALLAAG